MIGKCGYGSAISHKTPVENLLPVNTEVSSETLKWELYDSCLKVQFFIHSLSQLSFIFILTKYQKVEPILHHHAQLFSEHVMLLRLLMSTKELQIYLMLTSDTKCKSL